MSPIKPTALIILDGFGYREQTKFNAIAHAQKPTIDFFLKTYPHTLLQASGTFVGLPYGFVGNSEVGHITIGAGRVIDQPLTIINHAILSGEFFRNPVLINSLQNFKRTLHLIGLLSDAGVHGHINHLRAFLQAAKNNGVEKVVVHAILDGRDVAPQSARLYLEQAERMCQSYNGIIGTISGRFYAMDRDKNWDRVEQYYDCLTHKQLIQFNNWREALNNYYNHHITDEFIPPTQLSHSGIIKAGDGVIFFNYRPDRARELISCFIERHAFELAFFITPVSFDMPNCVQVMFRLKPVTQTLKEILVAHRKTIFSIAETEKYAHVTYFFGGGREQVLPGEKRVLIPSLPLKNYIEHPEMSAQQITQAVLKSLANHPADFYLINYANADMVGHSGDFHATVKAIECLDRQLKELFDVIVTKMNGTMYITADHGNAEDKWDEEHQQPRTSHTTNPVPFIAVAKGLEHVHKDLPLKTLSDIAPFILRTMGIESPKIMLQQKIKNLP